ncbi:MAG: ABC transporter permease [Candidatus Acetothermia bacterium]|jgi:putative hydroxymethylpyrimidine transport system permease protein|nr:ABC transporter permease [Candidatus Acetothermia bacterium]MDH7505195.1 ABC transporter permease [Candidatus Acetothermia bacterium]
MWPKARDYLPPLGLLLALFGLWELVAWRLELPFILPAPSAIFIRMASDWLLLLRHALVTLEEVLLGLAIAFIFGLALALLIFHSKTLERAIYPLVIAVQNVPVFAIAPILVLWLGYGLFSKVAVAALIIFFPLVVNTVDGLRSTDRGLVDLFRVLEASRGQLLLKLHLPHALPFILSGCKVGVTLAVVGAVIGEWVGSNAGLGFLMVQANARLKIDLLFAAIFWLAALSIALFGLVSAIERAALPWRRVGQG